MNRIVPTALIISAALMAALVAVGCSGGGVFVSLQAKNADAIKRGEYLVNVLGCTDCHTPLKMGPKGPEPDLARFLSGHPERVGRLPAAKPQGAWLWAGAATNTAFSGPWGVSYAANLTPDENTGLGIWTEEMFVKAMRTGRHMGVSREIMPPMPWTAIRLATDPDLKAMFAYLRSIKPIANHVPAGEPAGTPVVTQ